MSAVRIPPDAAQPRPAARSSSRSAGATVREVVDGLVAAYPGLGGAAARRPTVG